MNRFVAKHLTPEEEAEFRRQFCSRYELVALQDHLNEVVGTIPDTLSGSDRARAILAALEADARGIVEEVPDGP